MYDILQTLNKTIIAADRPTGPEVLNCNSITISLILGSEIRVAEVLALAPGFFLMI